jgi:hypothetical protein
MHRLIVDKQAEIAAICKRFHVLRLEVFGSAARNDDFDPVRSDVDFLVEFEPDIPISRFDAYFELKQLLEEVLGRPIDLISPSAVNNPYVRESIDRDRELVHAA